MGTASTMAVMAEALGMTLPGTAGTPAADSRLLQRSHEAGRLIIEMVQADRRPSTILTHGSFRNAIVALAAVGGSTNAVLHLLAIAGRSGIPLTLDDFDAIGAGVPLLANLQPAGQYLMDDLFRAGGVLAVLKEVIDLLDQDALTTTGRPLIEYVATASVWDSEVIHSRSDPLQDDAGIRVLRGNLAPSGAIIKPSAATPHLLQHRGRAVVFDSIEDFRSRIDDPDLEVDESSVLVLRGCGPKGYPGMPEVGNMPIPRRLVKAGVRDMVRVSDARMSGTAYGTVVLHVAPESAAGGPLGKVRDGDPIVLDVAQGVLRVDVPDLESREPSARAQASYAQATRGWQHLYIEHVMQADTGVDLDFLIGGSGHEVSRESH
jgi:dihydroxy-acid dehydratase